MRAHRPVRTVAIVIAMLALPPLALRAQAPAAARALLAQPHSQADLDARERLIAPLEKTAFNVVKDGDLFELEALLKGPRRQTLPQP